MKKSYLLKKHARGGVKMGFILLLLFGTPVFSPLYAQSGPSEICGDGVDNDGDGLIDEDCEICGDCIDNDGDGETDEYCEICGDGIDNDCDGYIDDNCVPEICGNCIDDDNDGMAEEGCPPVIFEASICDGIDNDCDGIIDNPGECEICGNGIDDDGDGEVDEPLFCGGGAEICGDGFDNNANGQVDEGCEICGNLIDEDGDGSLYNGCTEVCGNLIDEDGDGSLYNGCTEVCGNLIDEDGDGSLYNGCTEICANGFDDDGDGTTDIAASCSEVCNNGIDDNGNGFADMNDPACSSCGFTGNLLPNGDFEQYNSCPTEESQMHRATSWFQPSSQGTSDYFNCGFHPTTGANPFPTLPAPISGTGYAGFHYSDYGGGIGDYKEYIASTLAMDMVVGFTYTLSGKMGFGLMNTGPDKEGNIETIASLSPFSMVLYGGFMGTTPWGGYGCPPSWWRIEAMDTVTVSGNDEWVSFSTTFTAPDFDSIGFYVHANTFMLGGDCADVSPTPIKNYHYVDDLSLTYENATIGSSGAGLCTGGITLSVSHQHSSYNYQWYKNGVAIVGAINPTYNLPSTTQDGDLFVCRITVDFCNFCTYTPARVAVDDCIFPIELKEFTGKWNEETLSTDLYWTVLSESAIQYYQVERKIGNGTYEVIGKVNAFNNAQHNYYLNDENVRGQAGDKLYYKLSVMNMDGQMMQVGNLVEFILPESTEMKLYPSPANNTVNVLNPYHRLGSTLILTDMTGNKVRNYQWNTEENELLLSLEGLASGTYILKVPMKNGSIQMLKLVKE